MALFIHEAFGKSSGYLGYTQYFFKLFIMHLRIMHVNYKEIKLFCCAEVLLELLNLLIACFLCPTACQRHFCLNSYLAVPLLMLQCHAICHCLGHGHVPYLAYGHDRFFYLCHVLCGRHDIYHGPYHAVYHRESFLSDRVRAHDSFPLPSHLCFYLFLRKIINEKTTIEKRASAVVKQSCVVFFLFLW